MGVQVPIFPPLQTLSSMTEPVCLRAVRAALGPGAAELAIRVSTIRTWTMSGLVASHFQVRLTHMYRAFSAVRAVHCGCHIAWNRMAGLACLRRARPVGAGLETCNHSSR